jgi:hypothetical protein
LLKVIDVVVFGSPAITKRERVFREFEQLLPMCMAKEIMGSLRKENSGIGQTIGDCICEIVSRRNAEIDELIRMRAEDKATIALLERKVREIFDLLGDINT